MVAHVSVALSEDRNSILLAGHRLLDFYAKIPFYANMFSNAGFPLTSDQAIPDALVDNLVISGNEGNSVGTIHRTYGQQVVRCELMVSLVPTAGNVGRTADSTYKFDWAAIGDCQCYRLALNSH